MATRNTKTNPKKYLPSAQSKSLDIEPREIVLDPAASMQDGLDSLLGQIMAVYSVSDAEGPLTNRVERFLKRYPHLQVHRDGDTVVASTDLGRKNRVILAGHLDTVPVLDNFPPKWLAPGDPLIDKDVAEMYPGTPVMWGRGATDMKASDAVLLYLAATLTDPKVDLTFVFYDHEEVAAEYNGLGRVVEDHPDWIQGDFAIIGEPTSCGIEAGCNGTMRFDVIANGVAAHSARAWMGDNAIHKAAEILNRLVAHKDEAVDVDGLIYQEGLNATLISGGNGTNVIPSECRVHVNYRFAPDKTLAEAKALMIGEGAESELGNGEHPATGGSARAVARQTRRGAHRPPAARQARLDRRGALFAARRAGGESGRRQPAARPQKQRAGAELRPDIDGRHPHRLARLTHRARPRRYARE